MAAATGNFQTQKTSPPVANKKSHEMELFGDVRVDSYYWLRDDSRSNPDVLSHLHAENAYTDSIMSDTKQFEEQLYTEMRGRIKEDDISVPARKGSYYYYEKMLYGKEYVQHCRRRVHNEDVPLSVHDTMAVGADTPNENVILDENTKAQEHGYYKIGCFKPSPNNKLVVYAEDTKGDEIYTLYVIDAESLEPVGKPLTDVTSCTEWAGNGDLLYITMDEIHRPDKVWLHRIGTEQSSDSCLYHEKDDKFIVNLHASESRKYLFVGSVSKITRFVFHLDVSKIEEGLKVLTPKLDSIDTSVSHRGDHFFIQRRSDECFNSELLACPVDNVSDTTLLIPHRASVKLQGISLFQDHLVTYERENGLPKLVVYQLPRVGEQLKSLSDRKTIELFDPVYYVYPMKSEYSSSILRFSYSSLRTPPSVYDYDMHSGVSVLKKSEPVLGGFDASNYVTERKFATASDGVQVPISIVYQKNLVKLDGSDPLFLYGYGSYEICVDANFKAARLSLLDRGFVYAIAHIRGGGEMGRQWYENGKFLKKKNTFTDFIACAQYLLENRYGSKEKLCIEGRSAGGLLIGCVLNMRPDLFKVAVAGVPFVDVLTTMLDPTIPLTTFEWEEWGDPREEEFYHYMKSYSPVDNVKAQNYPHILVTAGLHDPCVLYSEPAKFVAKLRELKTDKNILLFKCELGAGHNSKSGRFPIIILAAASSTTLFNTYRSSCRSLTTKIASSNFSSPARMEAARTSPPVANKKSHEMEMFGDVRVDNYYWLRDDSRFNPDVLSHLHAENAYTDFIMSDTKQFEQQLYTEIRGRIKEDDITVPVRKGSYYYYERMLEGKEYVQHCRRSVHDEAAPLLVHDTMAVGADAPNEHVILDENIKAEEHGYYEVRCFKPSPDNRLVVYAEDTKGDEIYTVYVIDAESLEPVGKPLVGVTSYVEWAGNGGLLCITMDEIFRPDKDDKFSVDLYASESRKYLFVRSESKTTRFMFHLDVSKIEEGLKVLTPRLDGIDTSASHRGDHFFIQRRSDECFNSELLACPVDNVSDTTLLIPHRASVKLQDISLFQNHLVTYERENGLPKLVVYQLPPVGEQFKSLNDGKSIDLFDSVYCVYPKKSEYSSNILRCSYNSLRSPPSVYDYDMLSGVSVLKKSEPVLGSFDSSHYVTERKFATASDGIQVPISIVFRKNLVKLDGSDPLFLYGYGSYEVCIDANFKAARLSLLDRGFVYAIAHIRGGGEMGRHWYENGKFLKKKNTFTDFITCAEFLLENKYGSKEKLCIEGRSAGGLLIGGVLNMRPDLFKVAVAGVPFVDILTTMLDPTIPLTTAEWEEWGDPRTEEFYHYMKSYSPVDNVKAQNYPHILVTAGLHDPRVMYSEPAKFVAKLRELKTDENILLFKCELGAGHFSKSGRFEKLQEDAFTYAFILKTLNMIPSRGSTSAL
ncbi:hypothetical protein V2J09_001660 [Rumex salicifolius]